MFSKTLLEKFRVKLFLLIMTIIIGICPFTMADLIPYYIFTGEATDDYFGGAIASAGDVDNDDFDDLIIGASRNNTGYINAGLVCVFSGRTGGTLHIFSGEAVLDEFGKAVSGAGDVNNDGYADVIVGAPYFGANAGRVYVFSGQTGDTLHIFTGERSDRYLGIAVASAGDVNHDGYADLMMGGLSGFTYIFSGLNADTLFKFVIGRDVASLGDIDQDGFSDLIVSNYSTYPKAYVYSGKSGDILKVFSTKIPESVYSTWLRVSKGGDVDGDNVPDIIIGHALFDDGGPSYTDKGSVHVFSGLTGDTLYSFIGAANGGFFGRSVSFAGDINGDDYEDILIGASGRAFVFSGKTGDTLYTLTTEITGDSYGNAVSSAGDINNDGFGDFMVAAYGDDSVANNAGKVYVYLGSGVTTAIEAYEGTSLPYQFSLIQNYPNPFNPVTTIKFDLPRHSSVAIDIYNILGQKIVSLLDKKLPSGQHSVQWDGTNSFGQTAASGIYFYRFQAGDFIETRKMILLK